MDYGNRYHASFLLRHTIERLSVPFTDYSAMNLACFPTNFMLLHANFNLRSRQFLDCFSFGVCKVRDTTARKLKGVKRVGPRYSSRTPGSYFTNRPKKGLLHRLRI